MKNLTLIKLYNLADQASQLLPILLQATNDPMILSQLRQTLQCHGHAQINIRIYNEETNELITSQTDYNYTDTINADITIYQEWEYIYPQGQYNHPQDYELGLTGPLGHHFNQLYKNSCLDAINLSNDGSATATPSDRHPFTSRVHFKWNTDKPRLLNSTKRKNCLQLFNILDTQYADLIPGADGIPLVPTSQILNCLYTTYNPNTPHLQGLAILLP